jgi:hypothetical protein
MSKLIATTAVVTETVRNGDVEAMNSSKPTQTSTIVIDQNNDNNKFPTICTIKIVYSLLWGMILILIFGVLISLPVTELVMVEKYHIDLQCPSILTPYQWMLVEGSITLTVILMCTISSILVALSITTEDNNEDNNENKIEECILSACALIYIFVWIICAFHLIWLIIGSIIFWRDCVDSMPKPMNTLFWITLTMSWIQTYIILISNNSNKTN